MKVYGHGWILSGDEKMSKSKGNILDPLEIVEKYGLDPLRYYLIKEVSFGNDGNISQDRLEDCINSDLANNYGNLCQRVFSFIKKNCSNKIPKIKKLDSIDNKLLDSLKNDVGKLRQLINDQKLNEYIKLVVNYSFEANKYFNDLKPWSLKESDPDRMHAILFTITEHIKNISILLNPIIPITTNKVFNVINFKKTDINISSINNINCLNYDKSLKELNVLFKKIENDN